jgi:hypothetical protein
VDSLTGIADLAKAHIAPDAGSAAWTFPQWNQLAECLRWVTEAICSCDKPVFCTAKEVHRGVNADGERWGHQPDLRIRSAGLAAVGYFDLVFRAYLKGAGRFWSLGATEADIGKGLPCLPPNMRVAKPNQGWADILTQVEAYGSDAE